MKRIISIFLIFLTFNMYLYPAISFAEESYYLAEAEITKHPPEILATDEEDIPTIQESKSSSGWIWIVLGLLAVGGGVAALAGGGGGGGGSSSSSGGGDTTPGSVTVGW
ncbi:MAG: hypothetical protein HY754_09590 [Nitrospirae bacterium]|nr:hypothetical protein [Nitrospirota bacterium]